MRAHLVSLFVALVAAPLAPAGCGGSGPDVFAEGEALEAQGKLEEAAARFALTCAFAPGGDRCGAADGRAAEARIKAAEKALGEGHYLAAERLLGMSLFTADEAAAKRASERLGSDELARGLAYERALGRADKREVARALEEVAASHAPAAASARAWLDRERPGLLVAAVKAACGPAHEGSCAKASADLRAAAPAGAEADQAAALADEEERRVYPLRVTAEAFLRTFAGARTRDELIDFCKMPHEAIGDEGVRRCASTGGDEAAAADKPEERRQQRRVAELGWRRALRSIADAELVAALEARRDKVDAGVEIDKLDPPRPKPGPKPGPKPAAKK